MTKLTQAQHTHFPPEYYAGQSAAAARLSASMCRHDFGSAGAYWWHRGFQSVTARAEDLVEAA